MKTMWCNECGQEEQGSTDKEVMDSMWDHMEKEHPRLAAEISQLPEEEQRQRLEEEVQEVG